MLIEQRNKFSVGDDIEIMKPDGTDVKVKVKGMYTEDGESVESCPHPKQVLYLELSVSLLKNMTFSESLRKFENEKK